MKRTAAFVLTLLALALIGGCMLPYEGDVYLSFDWTYAPEWFDTDDWTWTGWVYADGSSVLRPSDETGRFIGVSAYFNPR